MRSIKTIFIIAGIIFLLVINIWYFFSDLANPKNDNMIWGASFSPEYAQYLGLDFKETYKIVLDNYKFKYLRLTARWDKVENQRGKFSFEEVDYLVAEAAKRQAKVVLAIGQKTPRWPECNVPMWAESLSDSEYFAALNNYLQAVVKHYKNNSAVEIWQIENEPFLAFGVACRALNSDRLQAEISAVKNIDSARPVLVTDSGELSFWNKTAKAGDLFGSTAYRVVWNKYLGYVGYDWMPAAYYRGRALLHGRDLNRVFVAELQAEPWMQNSNMTPDNIGEQLESMNLDRLRKNLQFAQQTGFSRAYLWGAEWWYWLELHGDPEIGDYIRNLKK